MMRGLWDRETVAMLLLIAQGPVAVAWLLDGGTAALVRLATCLLVAGVWHLVWMLARAQPPSIAGAVSALAIAMLAPPDLGPLQLALGISFGVVAAELAFGGWGRNLLHPATVTLAFLGFGFPGAAWPELPVQMGWATIPAGLMLVILGLASARLLAGGLAVWAFAGMAALPLSPAMPALLVVLAVLVADPVSSAATPLGRWLNGLIYGVLTTLFALHWADAFPVQLAVTAALLTSLVAPILDELALTLWTRNRRRRLG